MSMKSNLIKTSYEYANANQPGAEEKFSAADGAPPRKDVLNRRERGERGDIYICI